MLKSAIVSGCTALALLASVVFSVACEQPCPMKPGSPAATQPGSAAKPTPAPTPAAPTPKPDQAGWTVAYTGDFSGAKLPPEWLILDGDAKVEGGKLVVFAEAESQAQVVLKNPTLDAPSIRVELTGSISGEKIGDFSFMLNTSKSGIPDGYMLQFGGGGNTENRIRRDDGTIIDGSTTKDPLPQPDKKYTIVAENDKGHIRLIVDGKTVLDFKDPKPLSGARNGQIGLYTWGSTLKIDKLVVSTKK